MPKGELLAEFEIMVLAAIEWLGDERAYGVTIRAEIARRAKRAASIGAVYATLARLEQKGLVRFWISEPVAVRGGRARKHAAITARGRRALARSTRALERMLRGLDLGLGRADGR